MQTHAFALLATMITSSQAGRTHVGRKSRRAGRLGEAGGWYEGVTGAQAGKPAGTRQ